MKIYHPDFQAHLEAETQTLALCWFIEKRNGDFIRGTSLDVDIELTAATPTHDNLTGLYSAAAGIVGSDVRNKSDMSVDNMSIDGGLDTGPKIDLSVSDIESGLVDCAAVSLFFVNYQDPSIEQDIVERGYLGEIFRTSEGRYRTEIRGLAQNLQQNCGSTFGEICDVKRFGDQRCGLDVEALAISGEVTEVISRRRFNADLDLGLLVPDATYFETGEITFLHGANDGFTKQVKFNSVDGIMGHFDLWDRLPEDLEVGDLFSVKPGCNRTFERCKFWQNTNNFRGHGLWATGTLKIIRAPG